MAKCKHYWRPDPRQVSVWNQCEKCDKYKRAKVAPPNRALPHHHWVCELRRGWFSPLFVPPKRWMCEVCLRTTKNGKRHKCVGNQAWCWC